MNRYIVLDITEECSNDLECLLIWSGFSLLPRKDINQRTKLWLGEFLDLRRFDCLIIDNDVFQAIEGSCLKVVQFLLEWQLNFYNRMRYGTSNSAKIYYQTSYEIFCKTVLEWAEDPLTRPEISKYIKTFMLMKG